MLRSEIFTTSSDSEGLSIYDLTPIEFVRVAERRPIDESKCQPDYREGRVNTLQRLTESAVLEEDEAIRLLENDILHYGEGVIE